MATKIICGLGFELIDAVKEKQAFLGSGCFRLVAAGVIDGF
jgi:hypothetical protein